MQIILVGANHRSCPIDVRERLAFRPEQLPGAYRMLQRDVGLPEALILSTCNRVEIYAGVPEPNGTADRLSAFLSRHGQVNEQQLKPCLYAYTEPRSVEHLFSVASGLDSMVLGEAEILQQVKQAYELARDHGLTGKMLNVVVQKALHTGKAVRSQTGLGRGCVSIGTVAVELAQKIFGRLQPYTVLLVGAGKIGELTLKRLADRGVSKVRVLNRSRERAQRLAASYGACAMELESLREQLRDADIAILSTSSPEALVTRAQLAALMPLRRQRPLCLIDLGVPRNVEPDAGQLENVYLFDVDDLQGLVNHHHEQRRQALDESQAIVQRKVGHFLAWRNREFGQCIASSSSGLAAAP